MKRIWIVVGILTGVIVIGIVGYLGFRNNNPKSSSGVQAPQTATVTVCNVEQSVTAPGSVINFQEAVIQMPFDGKLTEIDVQPGDTVKTGQPLAQFDSTAQEIALTATKMNLAELTSPEAIANAELAITSAQADVITAQTALNNQQYWENNALIQDQYANLVIAKANLDKAQAAYDNADVGEYINNSGEAALYQALYDARQKYNLAEYYYSLYSQKPTERQFNAAQANLDSGQCQAGKRPKLPGGTERRSFTRRCHRLRFGGFESRQNSRSKLHRMPWMQPDSALPLTVSF